MTTPAKQTEKEMLALRIPRTLKKKLIDAAWEEKITLTEFVQRTLESAFTPNKSASV
ncbi:MAG: hypothetical protein AB1403_17420 [Candidatus Riflebacteria bacterium]